MRAHLVSWSGMEEDRPLCRSPGPCRWKSSPAPGAFVVQGHWPGRILILQFVRRDLQWPSLLNESAPRFCASMVAQRLAWLPLTVVLYGKAAFSRSNQKAVGFGLTEPNRSPGGHPAAEPSRALETAGGGGTHCHEPSAI